MSLRNFETAFRARYGAAVAFVVLAVAGGMAIQRSTEASDAALYRSQLVACERGNVLRAQVSKHVNVLDSFITEAAKARRVTGNPRVADSYKELQSHLKSIPQVDCERAIPKP